MRLAGVGRPAGIIDRHVFGPLGKIRLSRMFAMKSDTAIRSHMKVFLLIREMLIFGLWNAEDNMGTAAFREEVDIGRKQANTARYMQSKASDEEERRFANRLEKNANAAKTTKIKTTKGKR
jgi:hypothetical protein